MASPSQSSALTVLERQLEPLAPRFQAALAGMMPVERLIRTVMVSVERLPALLDCDRQSVLMAAMSAACLGLEVDGVTGQAYLIPFKGRAQLVIGYKGMNTLAARGGFTITGDVVREGDTFEFEKGSSAYVRHVPSFGNQGRIVAAWAVATHRDRPPIVEVMGVDEIMAVKGKSPGARRSDSPWNDPSIGFPAMAAKTVKRRLGRSLPLSTMQLAARLDEAHEEQGKPAWITPDRGLEIDGQAERAGVYEDSPTPSAGALTGPADAPPDLTDAERDRILEDARDKSSDGAAVFNAWRKTLSPAQNAVLDPIKGELSQRMKAAKERAEKAAPAEVSA